MQAGVLTRSIRRRAPWSVGICLALLGVALPAAGQVAAGYSEYYVPGDETVMRYVFDDLDGAGANYGMHAVVAVTAWSAQTTIYYDHWEDGYDFDPANPSTADETVVLANTGDRRVFESASIPTNPRGTATYYDGGDRIYVAGGTVTVTRASWIENVGVGNQSAAWEIFPVKPQLTTYVIPFGENLGFADFTRVYALVQATANGTTLSVDLNGDGTPDVLDQNRDGDVADPGDTATVTLQRGQTFLLDRVSAHVATLGTGVVIQGSSTLQVKFVAGNPGLAYCARGLSAFPRGFWTKEYYAPVDQPTAGGGNTDYYLYNPHATALTITWESLTATNTFSIPAGTTVSFRTATGGAVPVDSGLYFRASDVFWGVGIGDAGANAYEWGYSLLPSGFLYAEHFLGWAPGSFPVDATGNPGSQANDGVFLTVAQDNTRVFVDFNNDGTPDLIDANLDGTPESPYVTLNRLQTQFIYDPTDGDLSQAHFWATGMFTMAYGENADTADAAAPSLDLGYIAIPGTDFVSLVLTVDKSVSPEVVPTAAGSVATFTIRVASQKYTVDGVNVTDYLPPGWGYQVGADTTTIVRSDRATVSGSAADPAGAGTLTTLVWSSGQLGGDLAENQEITITFTARTTAVLAAGTLSRNRVQAVGTRTVTGATQFFTATDSVYVASGDLQITKTSTASSPLYPGDAFSYTVTVTVPAGGATLAGVSVYDALPAGVSLVPGSTTLSRSAVADAFATVAYTNNNGTRNWGGNWVETNDNNSATNGNFRVTGGELRLTNPNTNVRSIARAVSTTGATSALLSFSYRTNAQVDAADVLTIEAGTAGTAGAFTPVGTLTGIAGVASGRVSFDISAYISATTAIRLTIPAGSYNSGTTEYVYIDNLSVTYNLAVAGGNPPDLLSASSLYALAGGQSLSVGLNVTVDDPLAAGIVSLTNTASTTSTNIPMQVSASVTDEVTNPSVLSASAAGRVWYDADGGADQDIGEPGIGNVEVTIKDRFGTPLATSLTDTTGRFLFSGLPAGTGYYVEIVDGLPAGLAKTFPTSVAGNRTTAFSLLDGQAYSQADVGFRADAAVGNAAFGDQAWVDADSDGVRDAGEVGLAGATVTLYVDSNGNGRFDDGTDAALAATTTAPDGSYLFVRNVTVGTTHFVIVTTPGSPLPSYTPTTATVFAFPGVTAGGSYLTADFGFASTGPTYTISDRVFVDADGDGVLDLGETGLAGVTVELLDASLNVIATTASAADGTFTFSGVTGGGADYTVRLSDAANVLADFSGTTSYALARRRAEDNVAASVDRRAAPSFGFRATRSIGDTVWNDLDGDGLRDAGEPGIAGTVVSLYRDLDGDGVIDAGEPLVGSVTTDASGQYLFSGLTNGDYIVSVPTPAGYGFTGPGADSDSVTAGIQKRATMAGGNVLDVVFGFRASVQRTLSGIVWNDADRDGVQDVGEARLAGVTIDILSGTTVIATLTSDAAGAYAAVGLSNTTHTVRVTDTGSVLIGYSPTFERTEGTAGPFNYQETVNLAAGDVTNVHFGYARPTPTYAAVAYLTAFASGGSVVVEWRTTFETGTAGFHLLRLDADTQAWVRVDERLVPGLIVHPRGGTYRVRDASAVPGVPALYKLVEVDVRGREREYGPYPVTPAAATAAREERLSAAMARADRAGRAFDRVPSVLPRPRPELEQALANERFLSAKGRLLRRGLAAKVTTRETGVHHLSGERLAMILGRSPSSLDRLLRAGLVSLTNRGRQVPYLPAPDPAGLYFHAVAAESPYTPDNVYRLSLGRGLLMPGEPAAQGNLMADSFLETVHREEDRYPLLSYFQDPAADFWTWSYLFAGYGGYDTETAAVAVPNPAPGADATLAVHLMGGTAADHSVRVLLNGHVLGETAWTGIAVHDADFSVAASDLVEGVNTVEVKALLGPGGAESIVFLDSFDLGYRRLYRADSDALAFGVPDGASVVVSGFSSSSLVVLDVTDPAHPVAPVGYGVASAGDGGFALHLAAPAGAGDRRYEAVGAARARLPRELAAWSESGVRRRRNDAAYVLVAPDTLAEAARSLADYRSAQGMPTRVVDLESIFDEFNDGLAEPVALQRFFRFAATHGPTPLRYATLVGRGTWDPLDHSGVGDNLVPTALVGTPNGLVASDTALADISGDDGLPELAIGRLPVVSAQQLRDYLAKIEAFEAGAPGPWRQHVLLAADDPDAGGDFPSDSDRIAATLPSGHTTEKVYLPAATPAAGHQAILDAVNGGAALFNYVGHGSPERLAEEGLFASTDVPALGNAERLTLFVALTCSAGDFATPGAPSLGEAMLLATGGGAHAVWAPSGLSFNAFSVAMGEALFRALFVNGQRRVGDAAIAGLSGIAGPDAPPMRRMYNLLGEPVSRLPE